jgi:nucleoid DNA-binding protein
MEKRKLKSVIKRFPKTSCTHLDMLIKVARETGFTREDVGLVLASYTRQIKQELMNANSVKIKDTGTLHPTLHPPRRCMNMSNGEHSFMEARWNVVFKLEKGMKRDIYAMKVTDRDIEWLYVK